MLARTYFHAVAHHIRELLGCGAVLLALHSPEAESSHPLLQWLPDSATARLYGASELLALFQDEQVRALRDIACQRGHMRFINQRRVAADELSVENVAIAPLAYPAGIAGYLVLVDALTGSFTPGDVSLLDTYLQHERATTITPARQQRYLDIIMDQAGHLELLMGDLLDVSRIQSGKLALRYTEVDVASLCQQVMRLVQQRIDQLDRDRYILRCLVSPELPPLQTDATRLQQILPNLLDNAIKYSPDGGLIELQASIEHQLRNDYSFHPENATRSVAQITVRDQGIGNNALVYFNRLAGSPITSQVQD